MPPSSPAVGVPPSPSPIEGEGLWQRGHLLSGPDSRPLIPDTRIEDIIVQHDRRGVSLLRSYLPRDFCGAAARALAQRGERVLIITGFYVAGAGETDGPPGALALGRALEALGGRVWYVTDHYSAGLIASGNSIQSELVEFPISNERASRRLARALLIDVRPTTSVAIERCGLTRRRRYLNMYGQDISPYTARLDFLFSRPPLTVAVGDGGNELGMGGLSRAVRRFAPPLVVDPCATKASHPVIASVSNWGAYGLVAYLSRVAGRVLLPHPEEEAKLIRSMVAAGAVDGSSGRPLPLVDGFTLDENAAILRALAGAAGTSLTAPEHLNA